MIKLYLKNNNDIDFKYYNIYEFNKVNGIF